MSVARAETEVSGLSGHRERFTEALKGKAWSTGPQKVEVTAARRTKD